MTVTSISAASKPAVFTHSNIVAGVVANHRELDALTAALRRAGVDTVETLEGEAGANFLARRKHSFVGLLDFYLGDMETESRRLFANEVQEGHIVFAIPVTETNKLEVVKVVRANEAKHVVCFGIFVNESFGQL